MHLATKFALIALVPLSSAFAAASRTAVFDVQNMTCSPCPVTVKKSLQIIPGVEDAKMGFEHKTATAKLAPAKAETRAPATAATDAGCPATVHKRTI